MKRISELKNTIYLGLEKSDEPTKINNFLKNGLNTLLNKKDKLVLTKTDKYLTVWEIAGRAKDGECLVYELIRIPMYRLIY